MTRQPRQDPDSGEAQDAPEPDTHAGLIDRMFLDARVHWLDLPLVNGERHFHVRAGLIGALATDHRVQEFFRPLLASVRPWRKALKRAVDALVYAELDPTEVRRFSNVSVSVRVDDMRQTMTSDEIVIPVWHELRAVGKARASFQAAWFAEADRSLPRLDALVMTLGLARWPWLAGDLIDVTGRGIIRHVLDLDEPVPMPYGLLIPPRPRESPVVVEETGDREATRARAVSAITELKAMVERLDQPFRQAGTRPLHPGEPDALSDLGRILYCHRARGMSPGAIARNLDAVTAGRRPALPTKGQARIRADLKRAIELLDMDPDTDRSVVIFGEPTKAKIPD